jgi:hypothetical protein
MEKTSWLRLHKSARETVFLNSLLEALINEEITPRGGKEMRDPKTELFGLNLKKLTSDMKAIFTRHTGITYPQDNMEPLYQAAEDKLVGILAGDNDKYGPSFSVHTKYGGETLIVTAKAIRAIGIDPDTIKDQLVAFIEDSPANRPVATKVTDRTHAAPNTPPAP